MSSFARIVIVVLLGIAVAVVIAVKHNSSSARPSRPVAGVPRLVDLGSTTCFPCKMMVPILEDLRQQYAGRLQVDFIDVNQDPQAARPFGIRLNPTQVFLDAAGKELWRHEGFLSKQDILAKWKELGVDLAATPAASKPAETDVPVPRGST